MLIDPYRDDDDFTVAFQRVPLFLSFALFLSFIYQGDVSIITTQINSESVNCAIDYIAKRSCKGERKKNDSYLMSMADSYLGR